MTDLKMADVFSSIELEDVDSTAGDDTDLQNIYHTNEDIIEKYHSMKKHNITSNKMTKYEKAKIIGIRAEMIANGFKPLISVPKYIDDVTEIAKLELKQKKTPFIIRKSTSNNYEYWKISDMIIPD